MKSLETARKRLRQDLVRSWSQCGVEATAYGKCIAAKPMEDVKKDVCLQEFLKLKDCVINKMKR